MPEAELKLRLMVSWTVSLGVGHPSGSHKYMKPMKNMPYHTDLFELVTSLFVRGSQMGEMSEMG
jgi:hypothetical protein